MFDNYWLCQKVRITLINTSGFTLECSQTQMDDNWQECCLEVYIIHRCLKKTTCFFSFFLSFWFHKAANKLRINHYQQQPICSQRLYCCLFSLCSWLLMKHRWALSPAAALKLNLRAALEGNTGDRKNTVKAVLETELIQDGWNIYNAKLRPLVNEHTIYSQTIKYQLW